MFLLCHRQRRLPEHRTVSIHERETRDSSHSPEMFTEVSAALAFILGEFPVWTLLSTHRSLLSSKTHSAPVFQNQSQDPLGLLSQSGDSDPESTDQQV